MARVPDVALSPDELLLLQEIFFSPNSDDERRASLVATRELATRLLDRGAIPEVRLLYFTDPERNPGVRGKSRQDVFERNGNIGDEILCHLHFLKYLEYFIFGPKLPQQTIASFKEAAQFSDHLSLSDMQDLLPAAKLLVRTSRIDSHVAADEFHKLALECGAIASTAASLRDSIRKVRIPR